MRRLFSADVARDHVDAALFVESTQLGFVDLQIVYDNALHLLVDFTSTVGIEPDDDGVVAPIETLSVLRGQRGLAGAADAGQRENAALALESLVDQLHVEHFNVVRSLILGQIVLDSKIDKSSPSLSTMISN